MRKCRIGTAKFFTLLLLLYRTLAKVQDLSQIVLRMIASLNSVQDSQRRFVEIAADGVIDDGEIEDFVNIQDELEKISITVETLQIWSEQMIANGVIDMKKFNECKLKKQK